MDHDRFDALTRLLATAGSRRAALGALLGGGLLGAARDGSARKGKRRADGRDGGQGSAALRGEGGRQSNRRRRGDQRKSRKRRRRDDGNPEPQPAPCCGTRSCAPPEPGSTRGGCNFAGRSLAGGDYNGSAMRRIDGRGADFANADLSGAILAEACLQGASFRNATLGGSTWGDACLLDADFTGADLGGDSAVFQGAVFCRTTMPDGSRNDRDCDTDRRCCQACRDIGGACQGEEDLPCCPGGACVNGECVPVVGPDRCPVEVCQVGVRNEQGICVYVNSPNNQIGPACTSSGRFCCNGGCCRRGDLCLASGCCTPDPDPCQGRCGTITDNCGQTQQCGDCPRIACQTITCNPQTHVCDVVDQPNRTPCTAANGQNGICCDGACAAGGACCAASDCAQIDPCQPGLCQANRCVTVTEPDGAQCAPGDNGLPGICCGGFCLGSAQCCVTGDCADETCREKLCSDNICQYRNRPNGQQGPNCTAAGAFCCGQDNPAPASCCASGQTCSGVTCSGP